MSNSWEKGNANSPKPFTGLLRRLAVSVSVQTQKLDQTGRISYDTACDIMLASFYWLVSSRWFTERVSGNIIKPLDLTANIWKFVYLIGLNPSWFLPKKPEAHTVLFFFFVPFIFFYSYT
jgi:hypothetical protein